MDAPAPLPDVTVTCFIDVTGSPVDLYSLYSEVGGGIGGYSNPWYSTYTPTSNINANHTGVVNPNNVATFYLVTGRVVTGKIYQIILNRDGTKTIILQDKVPYNPFNFYIKFNVNSQGQLILGSQTTYQSGLTIGNPFVELTSQSPNPIVAPDGTLSFQMQGYEDLNYGIGHLQTPLYINVTVNLTTQNMSIDYEKTKIPL